MGRDIQVVAGVGEQAAPGGRIRGEAKAQEGEGGLGQDGRADAQGGGDDHRAEGIGQDVPHDQPPI